jgi:hypothetical protein
MADLFKIEGLDQLKRQLKKMKRQMFEEMKTALAEEAARLHGAAETQTPAASGELLMSLQRSSAVSPTKGSVQHVVAYTDEKAAAVHEGIHWGHKVEGTAGFKWFERTFNAFHPAAAQRIVGRLKSLVARGGA